MVGVSLFCRMLVKIVFDEGLVCGEVNVVAPFSPPARVDDVFLVAEQTDVCMVYVSARVF